MDSGKAIVIRTLLASVKTEIALFWSHHETKLFRKGCH